MNSYLVTSDGTIVSGDSLGSVKFWDTRTCTQLYSFQAHGADVLCMTISPVRAVFPEFDCLILTTLLRMANNFTQQVLTKRQFSFLSSRHPHRDHRQRPLDGRKQARNGCTRMTFAPWPSGLPTHLCLHPTPTRYHTSPLCLLPLLPFPLYPR
jgi:WD40 repeat protein